MKTKVTSVEEESKGVTQQLHDKVKEVEKLNKQLHTKDKELKESKLLLDQLQVFKKKDFFNFHNFGPIVLSWRILSVLFHNYDTNYKIKPHFAYSPG